MPFNYYITPIPTFPLGGNKKGGNNQHLFIYKSLAL